MILRRNIAHLIMLTGLKDREIAQVARTDPSTVSRWRNEVHEPHKPEAFAALWGVLPATLRYGSTEKITEEFKAWKAGQEQLERRREVAA